MRVQDWGLQRETQGLRHPRVRAQERGADGRRSDCRN